MRKSTLDSISYSVAARRGRKARRSTPNPYDQITQPGLHAYWERAHSK
ncbi:hypothetical protein [Sphingomonas jaspsi]|nr:hypothetical protein [Sphingomonas jaspsi]